VPAKILLPMLANEVMFAVSKPEDIQFEPLFVDLNPPGRIPPAPPANKAVPRSVLNEKIRAVDSLPHGLKTKPQYLRLFYCILKIFVI